MTTATLKTWRQSHALTQAEAAALFGVHPVTYARWELGTRTMDGAALRLATVLQTPQGLRLVQRLVKRTE
jgi:DNA-binding transcriptional regulator YiaG